MAHKIPFGSSQITPQVAQAALMLLQRCQIKPNEIPVYQQVAYALNQVANGQPAQSNPQTEPKAPADQEPGKAA